jgi:hypothetical protein
MNEARHPSDRNTRLWMVGLRYRDASCRLVHHYYLVTAADPGQALGAGRLRSCSASDRDVRKGAPVDGTWCEVSEVVSDFAGPPRLEGPALAYEAAALPRAAGHGAAPSRGSGSGPACLVPQPE